MDSIRRSFARLAVLSGVFALATSLATAQTEYYVDPVLGNDGNTGLLGNPFQTVTHAHSVVTAGDTINLVDGTYAAAGFGGFETFPLILQDGVNVRAVPGDTPVFDANGNDAFAVQTRTVASTISGITVTDCGIAMGNAAGASVFGLTVSNCTFTNFSGAGVLLNVESGGASQVLVIEDCTFSGNNAARAISVKVADGTTLLAGTIRRNEVTGGVDDAIVVTARDTATVTADFAVENNTVTGFGVTGITVQAIGEGNLNTNVATNRAAVRGNTVTGAGLGAGIEVGLKLSTEFGAANEGARLESAIEFNEVSGCSVGVSVFSGNDGASLSDNTPVLYGNHLRDCSRAAEVLTQAPTPGNANAAPDFGSASAGGANTFSGNTEDLWSTLTTPSVNAQSNFFPGGPAGIGQGAWDVANILSETLTGSFADDATANQVSTVELNAAALVRFVDNADPDGAAQLTVVLDGSPLASASVSASALGDVLSLIIPSLVPATYSLEVTNPGGQTGTFSLKVIGGTGGGNNSGDGGCFVATAAHGDYSSKEVYELRRLRDQYLQTNSAGRSFIRWYYEEGPTAAAWIGERDWARKSARAALAAPVALSSALTHWNSGQRFAFGVLMLGLAMAVARRRAS